MPPHCMSHKKCTHNQVSMQCNVYTKWFQHTIAAAAITALLLLNFSVISKNLYGIHCKLSEVHCWWREDFVQHGWYSVRWTISIIALGGLPTIQQLASMHSRPATDNCQPYLINAQVAQSTVGVRHDSIREQFNALCEQIDRFSKITL